MITRNDLYIAGLALLQIFIFLHLLAIINGGAALSSISAVSVDSYIWLTLLCGLSAVVFWNLSSIAQTFADEECAKKNVFSIARRSVLALGLYAALDILNALTLLNTYGGY